MGCPLMDAFESAFDGPFLIYMHDNRQCNRAGQSECRKLFKISKLVKLVFFIQMHVSVIIYI